MFRVKPRATLSLILFTVLIQKSETLWKVFSGCLKNLPSGILKCKFFQTTTTDFPLFIQFFGHTGLVKRDLFHCHQTQLFPREYHSQGYIVEVQTLVELNPNILVRPFQRRTLHTLPFISLRKWQKSDPVWFAMHPRCPSGRGQWALMDLPGGWTLYTWPQVSWSL